MSADKKRLFGFIEKIKSDSKLRFILIVLSILSLVLIIGVNFFGNNSARQIDNADSIVVFVNNLEDKLENLLSKVEGAGKVSVAIKVDSGMETVLAYSTTTKETVNGKEITSAPIIVNGKTVTLKELYPKITGVLIVAEGANKISVYSKIQQAAVSLLDINVNQIDILAMK